MTVLAAGAPGNTPTLASFGHDTWWLIIIKVLAIFAFLMLGTLFTIWAERRVIGRMQQRPGPNRAGKYGLLQSLVDGIKLPLKEDIVPRGVDKVLFVMAPAVSAIPAFISFAIIPVGPIVSIFGVRTPLQLADLPVAVLLVLAMSSMGVYGIVLAGWASASPYSLLGGLRSSAQVISYEIAMGLAFVPVFLEAGSLSTTQIVQAQARGPWFAIALLPSFLIYIVTMVGETNRLPFDLPEGEGELVGGYHTEYSSLKFALFYLAEYVSMFTVGALATTMFLGGWRAPWPLTLWAGANSGWWPVLWFVIKLSLFIFFFIWLRGSLPRIRYDQLMALGWKVLIPIALAWALIVAGIRVAQQNRIYSATWWFSVALVVVIFAVLYLTWERHSVHREQRAAAQETAEAEWLAEHGPAFPVPPLDLPHYHGIGVNPAGSSTAVSSPDSSPPPQTEAGAAKEVTGA